MAIEETNAVGASDSQMVDTRPSVKPKELQQKDFMKLFLAQLRMQNPLKPNDNSAMIQQMSQLGSLSATQDLQKTIKNLSLSFNQSQALTASQLINKKVQLPCEMTPLVNGEGISGSVILPSPASNVTITITDADKKVVKTITLPAQGSTGVLDYKWDDEEAKKLNSGMYHVAASAKIDGQQVALVTNGTFKINSVALDSKNGTSYLNLDGYPYGSVEMKDIIKIL